MRHFVFEFITGGGLSGRELPVSLAREGDLMASALVNDLKQLPGDEIMLCRDERLPGLDADIQYCIVSQQAQATVLQAINNDDLVWLIAPETGGCLVEWAELFMQQPVQVLVSGIDSLRACSSKFKTCEQLKQHGIPVIHTVVAGQPVPASENGWVIKPDDGAGAEGVRVFSSEQQLQSFIAEIDPANWVIQPRVNGSAMSLSMLCYDGQAKVVGCNQQEIDMDSGVITLQAVSVNAYTDKLEDLQQIASDIAMAMPGLRGYIGVDLVQTVANNYTIVEINPRLTTAYVGLSESLGINLAAQIIETFQSGIVPPININGASKIRIPL
ncbi:MAG: ATP-grasp domain-containing protein [Gammaproteobacteria bacterium]